MNENPASDLKELNWLRRLGDSRSRIRITDELREILRRHRERTGVGPYALIGRTDRPPPDLTWPIVEGLLNGRIKSVRGDHLSFLLQTWRALPGTDYVPLTGSIRAELRYQRTRTCVGAGPLLLRRDDKPRGLTASVVGSWLDGRTKSAREHYLHYVLTTWRALPTASTPVSPSRASKPHREFIAVTPRIRDSLHQHKKRTGRGPHSLLSDMPDVPEGLTPRVIMGWLEGRSKTARWEHIDYVRKLWRRVPTLRRQ